MVKWATRVINAGAIIAMILILAMTLLMTADVFGRYIGKSITFSIELSQFMLVAIIFLGLAWTQSRKGHIQIDLLTSKLGPRNRALVNVAGLMLSVGMMALLTWRSGAQAIVSWQKNEIFCGAVFITVWPSRIALPVGGALLCVQLLIDLWREVQGILISVRSIKAE